MGTALVSRKDLVVLSRKKASHKGDNGYALVIGGSEEYVGAPYLAAIAALRTGIDKVTVAAPERVAWALSSMSPDLITIKLKGDPLRGSLAQEDFSRIRGLASQSGAFLIGNGIGRSEAAFALCRRLVQSCPGKPKVIDADAIRAVRFKDCRNAIWTPHAQEFKEMRLAGLQRKMGSNVLLRKGPQDEIVSCARRRLNRTGNPMMTVSGTGDVLAGLCLGFLAQSGDLWKSACTAAYICGTLGDELMRRQQSFTASDMLPLIPIVCKKELRTRFL
jgi:ADP-dependent NAD(P)H-hydrate dehydratase / NAD(P)H-hydrate epimerase